MSVCSTSNGMWYWLATALHKAQAQLSSIVSTRQSLLQLAWAGKLSGAAGSSTHLRSMRATRCTTCCSA